MNWFWQTFKPWPIERDWALWAMGVAVLALGAIFLTACVALVLRAVVDAARLIWWALSRMFWFPLAGWRWLRRQ